MVLNESKRDFDRKTIKVKDTLYYNPIFKF